MLAREFSRKTTTPAGAAAAKNVSGQMPYPTPRRAIAVALGAIFATLHTSCAMAQSPAEAIKLPTVDVIGTTPLPGLGQARNEIPAPVQTVTGADIDRSQALDLSAFMNRNLGSVHINEVQNNPFQPDVNYRGYTASPLLGTPQGLSVYMDGVRLNQPLGDVVSWDLIPRSAIASLALMPGSNPLFGLNTLGGALSIQTKDGLSHPGTAVQAIYGSNERRAVEFEHGGSNQKGLNWFLTGNLFKEDGWRDDSPSDVHQLFGKLGWADARTDLSLTAAYANTKLYGNGLQEKRLLERNYDSVYTKPDITENNSVFLNLAGKHSLSDAVMLSGNAYYRRIKTSTFNGDINDDSLTEDEVYAAGEDASNTPFPSASCLAAAAAGDDEAAEEACNGAINRGRLTQENYGVSGQFTLFGKLAGQRNQFTAGAGYDASRSKFRQSGQFGYLNPDRSVTGVDAESDESAVDLTGRTRTWSLYATDTLSIQERWHLTLSGRYNHTSVKNRDNLLPGGGPGSLDGNHSFSRFNPAVGLSFTPSQTFNAYAGYNEGSRTPTAIELGCADPANPCKLPNAMAGDPPLQQVVTKTWEAGLRGALSASTKWNAGIFRAENHDDILFVATSQAGFGHFKNFGKTRRQGIELGLDSKVGKLDVGANYTYLDATFQSRETVNGASNSSSDADAPGEEGNIQVRPGDRLPLIPRHLFKLHADYHFDAAFSAGLSMLAVSGSYARGNENNRHQPDGTFYLGSGKTSGYAVFNLNAKYKPTRQLTVFGQVNNLFDRKYYTAAQLGATGFTAGGNFVAQPFGNDEQLVHSTFYAPGAPRTFWLGVRYEFDKLTAK